MKRSIRFLLAAFPVTILFFGLIWVYGRLAFPLFCALFIHELGHFFFLCGRANFRPSASGLLICPQARLSYKEELAAALAGPLFNLLCALFSFLLSIPPLFFFNVAYALCNLLPLPRLDGGRVLDCLLHLSFSPSLADGIFRSVSFVFFALCLFTSFWFLLADGWYLGLLPFLISLLPQSGIIFEKKRG